MIFSKQLIKLTITAIFLASSFLIFHFVVSGLMKLRMSLWILSPGYYRNKITILSLLLMVENKLNEEKRQTYMRHNFVWPFSICVFFGRVLIDARCSLLFHPSPQYYHSIAIWEKIRVNTDNNTNLIANIRKNLRAHDVKSLSYISVYVTDLSSSDNNDDDDQSWGDWVIQ